MADPAARRRAGRRSIYQLANIRGVPLQEVQGWIAEGCPHEARDGQTWMWEHDVDAWLRYRISRPQQAAQDAPWRQDGLLTTTEAAAQYNVVQGTVYQWLRRGCPVAKREGRTVLLDPAAVEAWQKDQPMRGKRTARKQAGVPTPSVRETKRIARLRSESQGLALPAGFVPITALLSIAPKHLSAISRPHPRVWVLNVSGVEYKVPEEDLTAHGRALLGI